MHEVVFSPSAKRDLAALPRDLQILLRQATEALSLDPRPNGVKKLRGGDNAWRIRVGKYRVLYEIHDKILMVFVIRISHRKDAYRS